MNVLSRIEFLRSKGESPSEIERLLLCGKLGKANIDHEGYQYVKNLALSWLVVEVHRPGFIKWMRQHPNEYVVHHIDRNILNNAYINLQVMSRGNHQSVHRTDPKYAEVEKARLKKVSESRIVWYKDKANAKTIESANEKRSRTMVAYHSDPKNAKAIRMMYNDRTKDSRKNWRVLDSDLFTVGEYSAANGISPNTAFQRLTMFIKESQITCEKKLIGSRWCNVYRNIEK